MADWGSTVIKKLCDVMFCQELGQFEKQTCQKFSAFEMTVWYTNDFSSSNVSAIIQTLIRQSENNGTLILATLSQVENLIDV